MPFTLRTCRYSAGARIFAIVAITQISSGVAWSSGSVYSFHEDANVLLRNFFPNNVFPDGVRINRVVFEPMRPPRDAEDFFQLQARANEPLIRDTSGLEFSGEILDSPYATISHINGFKPTFLLRSPFYEENLISVRKLSTDELRFGSVREKVLFQRDLFQIIHVVFRVLNSVNDQRDVERAGALLDELLVLFPKTFITEIELDSIRNRKLKPNGYSLVNTWKADNNYLPGLLFGIESSFVKIPIHADQTVHFAKHSGRSFFHVYISAPEWSSEKIIGFWRNISSQYGIEANVATGLDALPAGTETMLTRSAGIFLKDGSYVDSGVLEEVLLRSFKYTVRTLDISTTDYWGTNYSEFVLDRGRFLRDEHDISLKEKSMDSLSYWGVHGEAYESSPVPFPAITITKWNCYTCHSLVGYGTSTVLTMRLQEPGELRDIQRYRDYLKPVSPNSGRFELVSPLTSYARLQGHFQAFRVD